MPKCIHYIASNPRITQLLGEYMFNQGFEWTPYDLKTAPEVELLLIVEPVEIENELFAISTAWKAWMMEFRPATTFLVAAFVQSEHPNCLDLSDLPASLSERLTYAKALRDYPLLNSGMKSEDGKIIYVDPWAFNLPKPGYELKERLKRFVDGHDATRSFLAQIATIRSEVLLLRSYQEGKIDAETLRDSAGIEVKSKERARKDLEQIERYFENRLKHYEKIFDYLPYQDTIKTLMADIENGIVKPKLSKRKLDESVLQHLDNIILTTKRSILPYIYPEAYW